MRKVAADRPGPDAHATRWPLETLSQRTEDLVLVAGKAGISGRTDMIRHRLALLLRAVGFPVLLVAATARAQPGPDTVVPPGLSVLATTHAQGAQIYECRAGADGRATWAFREPVATLLEEGRTVGRHYVGPSWEWADGGAAIVGRVAARLPGAGSGHIPWLRLEVAERRGPDSGGRLGAVTVILRVNTDGGVAEGPCPAIGAFQAVAYSADYVFLTPSGRK